MRRSECNQIHTGMKALKVQNTRLPGHEQLRNAWCVADLKASQYGYMVIHCIACSIYWHAAFLIPVSTCMLKARVYDGEYLLCLC